MHRRPQRGAAAAAAAAATAVLPALTLCLVHLRAAHAMQFNVDLAAPKCIVATVPRGMAILADFHVAAGTPPMPLDLHVYTERGAVLAHERDLTHTKFTIPAQHHSRALPQTNIGAGGAGGDGAASGAGGLENLRFCLVHKRRDGEPRHVSGSRRVTFDIYPDYKLPAGTFLMANETEPVAKQLRDLSVGLVGVLRSMDELRRQEERLSQINSATATHLVFVSSLTCIVIVAVGLIQFDSIKSTLKTARKIGY